MSVSNWQWFGTAGHFICSNRCLFRMHTHVGKFCVSTVGDFRQSPGDREPTEIGHLSLYETMVFDTSRSENEGRWGEIMTDVYMTEDSARAGHMAMCERFDRRSA